MSQLFRGKFVFHLKQRYENGELKYRDNKKKFSSLIEILYKKEWVTYAKPPFKNTETLFRYLANYTHRIAISNYRIIKVEDDRVYFRWKDYSDSNKFKVMALDAHEFIRRFLLHILPKDFVKIRHYGLFCNKSKKSLLIKCREMLDICHTKLNSEAETWQEMLLRITGIDVQKCPFCGKGNMRIIELIPENCNSPPHVF
jgi:hypothetical protein